MSRHTSASPAPPSTATARRRTRNCFLFTPLPPPASSDLMRNHFGNPRPSPVASPPTPVVGPLLRGSCRPPLRAAALGERQAEPRERDQQRHEPDVDHLGP